MWVTSLFLRGNDFPYGICDVRQSPELSELAALAALIPLRSRNEELS